MKIPRYLCYDINQGIQKTFYVGLCIIVLTILVLMDNRQFIGQLIKYGYCNSWGTYIDYIVYFFRGDYVYELSPSTQFRLPTYWITFHSLIAYAVGFYPYEDFVQYGKISILYGKSKTDWWISKVLWQIVMVIWCYFIVYGTIAVYVMLSCLPMRFQLTEDIWNNLSPEVMGHSNIDLLITVCLLPLFTSITIAIIEGVGSFFWSPVVSFILVISSYVISVYSTSYFWLGNYTMWLRNQWVAGNGINSFFALCIDVVICASFLKLGIKQFDNIDIIEKQKIM